MCNTKYTCRKQDYQGLLVKPIIDSLFCDVLTPNCHNCKARTRSTQQPILINAYSRPMSTAHAHIYLTPSPYSVSIVSKVSEEASVFGLDIRILNTGVRTSINSIV